MSELNEEVRPGDCVVGWDPYSRSGRPDESYGQWFVAVEDGPVTDHDTYRQAMAHIALLAVSALVLTFVVLTWRAERLSVPPSVDGGRGCVEDDPCWDCETMGNLICGEAVRGGDSLGPAR